MYYMKLNRFLCLVEFYPEEAGSALSTAKNIFTEPYSSWVLECVCMQSYSHDLNYSSSRKMAAHTKQ